MLKSNLRDYLCDYNDAYIIVKGTITVPNMAAGATNSADKKAVQKRWLKVI